MGYVMTSKADIKNVILKTAGYPETGVIKDFADELAEAIVKLIDGEAQTKSANGSLSSSTKETRIVGAAERR
jgi:hypothetical protein